MRSIAGLWRWRRNPLCRSTDRVEGWLTLSAVLLITLATPAAAVWGGRAAHQALLETARDQYRQRYQVWATVAETAPPPTSDPEPDSGYRVAATWTAADGRTHTGTVTTDRAAEPGDRLRVWTDARGHLTSRPMDAAGALSHAVLAGIGTAGVAAGLVETVRRLAVRRLMARRYARWEEEWARVGPDWGRADRAN
ncbi:Rv1733c family protein [Streptomyces macrosporus]|uniref:Integral membrane protein n=1 Tax=Streptomyces macrosporus TaxID=44032 RepID=A0ABN3J7F0_9ACTN